MKELKLKNLSAGYEKKEVVSDINAKLSPGEILMLLGRNGAGKSTILLTAAGLIPAVSGSVEIDGRAVEKIPAKERARIMSVLLPEEVKQNGLSCRETVELGRYPYTGYFGQLSAGDREAVDEIMEMTGISALAECDIGKLSDGQRQRVRLARCLAQEPEIMILDEPTVFLDLHYQAEFMALLMKLAKEKNIAVMMSVHDPDLAVAAADSLLCLKDGRMLSYGSVDDIIENGSLRSLYELDELGTAVTGNARLKAYTDRIGRKPH